MKTLFKICLITLSLSTMNQSIHAQLSGSYTIGSGGNYTTITEAVNALVTVGVNGPVIFNILPGVYQENISFNSVPGLSSANNVTFKSSTNDTSSVGWQPLNFETPIINIINVGFVSFKYLSFRNGVYGINVSGTSGIYPPGINISNNNFYRLERPIEIWYADSPVIEKNVIRANDEIFIGADGAIALRISGCLNGIKVLKNKLSSGAALFFGGGPICLQINSCTGNNSSLIANNFFNTGARVEATDIDIVNSSSIAVCFNTCAVGGVDSENYRVSNSSSIVFKDNINVNYGGIQPIAFSYNTSSSSFVSDFNTFELRNTDYFSKVNGSNISTLLQFVSQTGNDSNSNIDTIYFAFNDAPHLAEPSIGDPLLWGVPIPGITDDIDDDPRDPFEPYKGADEPPRAVSIAISLHALIEGFYDASTNRQVGDTIDAYLHSSVSPYNKVDSVSGFLKPDGKTVLRFLNAQSGTYYISLNHRNSIETWSKSGGEALVRGGYSIYDLTSSSSQAFGNNIKQVDVLPTRFAIYSGDVDQEGTIDLTDIANIFNGANNFVTGYVSTDITGDNFVDLSDITIAFNNSMAFVSVIRP